MKRSDELAPDSNPLAFLLGGGEMGSLIRSMDWSKTTLGPVTGWPQSLRTTLSICLASDLPICVIWGPGLVQIYNDAYRVICGDKHPRSMGQNFSECWKEAWPVIGEAHDSAFAGDKAFLEAQQIFLDRHGYVEECFFTFSFSPIRDEAGRVGGLFHPVIEMTTQMLSERRTRALRDLAFQTSQAKSVSEALYLSAQALAAHDLDLPFVLLYALDPDGDKARLLGVTGLKADTPASPSTVGLNEEKQAPWPLAEVVHSGSAVQIDNVRQRVGSAAFGPYTEPPNTALALPIILSGADRPAAIFIVGISSRLPMNDAYRGFYDLLASAVTSAVSNARAYDDERMRAKALAEVDQAKIAFFSNVSHEFRTPLTLMLGPVEDALAAPESHHATFNSLIENAPFGVYVVDAQFCLCQASAAAHKAFASVQPLIGRHFGDVVRAVWPEPFASEVLAHFRLTLDSGKAHAQPTVSELRKDSPHFESYDWKIERIVLPDGAFGVVCYFYDLTERQQAAEALRLRTAQFETLVNEAPLGIYLVDAQLRIRQVNPLAFPEFDNIHGLIGSDMTAVMQTLWGPARADEIVQQFRHTLSTGESFEDAELIALRADRSTTAYYEWQIHRIPLPDGSHGVVCYFRDISARVQAKAQILDSELRFRALVSASSDVVYRMNADWTELRHLLGREFIADTHDPNRSWLEKYIPLEDQPRILEVIQAAIGSKGVFELEHRVIRVDGTIGWTFSRAIPMLDGNGEIREWFGAASDVTARKQAEFAIRAEEGRSRTILESITDGFYTLDSDWRFTYMNSAGERFMGRTPGDLIGKCVWDEYPGSAGSEIELVYRRVVAGQAAESFTTYYPNLDRWYVATVYPAPDGLTVYFRDVTEKKHGEELLRASEERRRLALDAAELGTWFVDPATRVTTTDARYRAIFGTTEEWTDYLQAIAVIHPDDQPAVLEAVAAATRLEDAAPYAIEYRINHPDGSLRWILANGRASFEGTGPARRVISFDGTVADITERKQGAEERERLVARLREQDQRKDEFLATLAHELRNPLAPIRNGLHILRLAHGDPNKTEQVRLMMERQLGQMVHLIDDLLDMSRISRGKIELRKERIELASVIAQAIETSRPLIAQANHELLIEVPPGPIYVDADLTRLTQVFSNLLNNSAKFTERGGRVRLAVQLTGLDAVVSVTDNGIGIPTHLLPRVFEMFTQGDGNLERSRGGLGIGLAIVQRLVQMHGGSVEARSGGPGKGSEFVVRLPVALSLAADKPTDDHDPCYAATRHRILVVDDNVDAANSLGQLLEMLGNEVLTCYDGASGINAASTFRPGILLCDIAMPKMNGYDTARSIRAEAWGKNIVLVALTGYGQVNDLQKSADAGFDHHLVKPLDVDALMALVAGLQPKPA